ncbi:MAG: HDOD domain-containing protein [Proteobacteria bacterium]|nr:HDOD domain-containing protein [Pseudomonadota bacterium]
MNAPSLEEVLAGASALPTLPEVASFVISTIDDDTSNADSLVVLLNTDPAIVARILAAANSSAFGLSSRVDSMREAILVLGLEAIRSITLATAIVDRFNMKSANFDPRMLWRHSLGVATCARVIAEENQYNAEVAFTAGLLHDIGQLLLFAVAPKSFEQVLMRRQRLDETIIEAEQAVFGFDHAIAGGELIKKWRLPNDIADGILGHHDPERDEFGEMGDLVHVAEVLSHALDLGELPNNRVPDLSGIACARMGIEWPAFSAKFGEIEARYDELLNALSLQH